MSLINRILHAVLYANVFQYPMTVRELWKWIPTAERIPKRTVQQSLRQLVRLGVVSFVAPFVVVKKHASYIGMHAERLMYSRKKWTIARRAARFLRLIPTVLFVGVTGSLAMNNAGSDDDIDLCIIAAKGTVWVTRLLSTVCIELVAHRRHPHATRVKDTVCLNMFLSEHALAMGKDRQDAYIAHELLQMVPLWERKGIERKLLTANTWTKDRYRHAYDERMTKRVYRIPRKKTGEAVLRTFERSAEWLQLWYMKKRRTTEVVTATSIWFHPTDMRRVVFTALNRSLEAYKIPLDKTAKRI